ncbi:MAG: type II toxin-antitoxin system VapC family toxin [Candidatus Dormibacteria bacterium]
MTSVRAHRAIYVDSSAIVKLVVEEPESAFLRRYLRGRGPLIVSALARVEVSRALLALGRSVQRRGEEVLTRFELIRVNDRIIRAAGMMLPPGLRSLDALHLATARELGADLDRLVTFDVRMISAAVTLGLPLARLPG